MIFKSVSRRCGGIFDRAALEEELGAIDHEMQQPGFWDHPEESATLLKKRRVLERQHKTLEQLDEDHGDLETWRELVSEGEDDPDLGRFLVRLEKDPTARNRPGRSPPASGGGPAPMSRSRRR